MQKVLFFFIVLLFGSCNQYSYKAPRKITIGFSQCTTQDEWRKTMIQEMRRETGFHPNYEIELIISDANNDNEKQIRDIRELMKSKIDLLIVSPNEAAPLTPIVEEVYDSGMPVIVIDRRIESEKFTSYIGGDNLVIGKEAAFFANQLLKGKGKILEITGLAGSTPAVERSLGFLDGLKEFQEIEVVRTIRGAWLKERTQVIVDTMLSSWKDFDLIFAHNDRMAYGAFLSSKKHNLRPFIIGVDGLHASGHGIDMVLSGEIDGTFLYPTGGDKALDLALKILDGKPYSKFNYLQTIKIDYHNARAFKLQAEQLIDQQQKIDYQRKELGTMAFLLKKKETLFISFTIISGLLFLLMIMSVYLILHKNKVNRALALKRKTIQDKNERITKQRDKLIQTLRVAEEATEAKIKFFTNVSHEIRTVLSLISLPVNQLSSNGGGFPDGKIQLLKKSVSRLLTLSEEILTFRSTNYNLKFQTSDLAACIRNIVKVFEQNAVDKGLLLNTAIPDQLTAYFDPSVIEKVIFNLLSNAIKYTPAGGKVEVKAVVTGDTIKISITDDGIGISDDELPFIFDRFYRGNSIVKNNGEPGNGVGLNFTRELIQLHGGEIKVESRENMGSIFTFSLPQKNGHLSQPEKEGHELNGMDELHKDLIKRNNRKKILLVEDIDEMRIFMSDMLMKHFMVMTAKNGIEGFELANRFQPDIIVSDILMPEKDGIALCFDLKNNPSTFLIPVILLTAMESENSYIRSFETGADAYLTKPCNETLLLARINNLIKSRARLKDEYDKTFFSFKNLKTREKGDEAFVKNCLEEIYKEASDPNFNLIQLSRAIGMSRSSLYRKIKEVTGLKAVDFMRKAKLQYAAKLLINCDMTVYEIAWQSGFSDVKYFSKLFAKEFGSLPKKFKDHSRNETVLP